MLMGVGGLPTPRPLDFSSRTKCIDSNSSTSSEHACLESPVWSAIAEREIGPWLRIASNTTQMLISLTLTMLVALKSMNRRDNSLSWISKSEKQKKKKQQNSVSAT